MKKTFYWYDYETFGLSARTDKIAQFGGMRTDDALNVIGKPLKLYCQPPSDSLPNPKACLTHGITPQLCQQKGLIECEFIAAIHQQFAQPNTCIVGYNNIRFDDEFTRFALYRNFFDAYGWHWQNGNSRWDLIDVVRMCYALKKDNSLNWVYRDGQNPVFKLDQLAPANGIEHGDAHDALADVSATIALAKIIKTKQPKLFDYALALSDKKVVAQKLTLFEPMLHTSSKYKNALSCTRLVVALAYHPVYKDRAIVFNVDQDPAMLLDLSLEVLAKRLYHKKADLAAEGIERIALKELTFNKSPMFISNVYKVEQTVQTQLQLDMSKALERVKFIQAHQQEISQKITDLYRNNDFTNTITDVDQMLYEGFFSSADKKIMTHIQTLDRDGVRAFNGNFDHYDPRLKLLWRHFKARNYPDLLTDKEAEYWFETIQNRLQEGKDGHLSVDAFFAEIETLNEGASAVDKNVLDALAQYGQALM